MSTTPSRTHPPRDAPHATPAPVATATDTESPRELPAPEEHELIEGPSREDLIRRRAYDLYERNGGVDGHALDDWLAAEAELDREVMEGASPMEESVEHE
jgi:hypothetical protein